MSNLKKNIYNIITLGETEVGKTSFLNKLTYDKFSYDYHSTIGVETFTKEVTINSTKIKVNLYDTAGQERYYSISNNYIKNSDGIFFIFDLTSNKSTLKVFNWIESIKQNEKNENIPILFIGNKLDLADDKREVSYENGYNMAKEYNSEYFEVSALTGEGIKESFEKLVELILIYKNNSNQQDYATINLTKKKKKVQSNCCKK